MKQVFIAAALATAAFAGVAIAQNPPRRPMPVDANGDGTITRAEYLARAEADFARIDSDHDGKVTVAEREAARAARRGAMAGGPGMPPPPPMAQAAPPAPAMGAGTNGGMAAGNPAEALMRLDTDRDGRISKAEYAAGTAARFTRMDANNDGKIDPSERPQGRMGGPGADGTMTRAEFEAQAGDRFARLDMNDDGYIDAAERATIGAGRGAGRRAGGKAGAPMAPPPPPPAPSGQ